LLPCHTHLRHTDSPPPTVPVGGHWPDRCACAPPPKPAVVDLIVAFSLPEGGRTTFELIDIAGRRVLERKFDYLAPGPQTVRLDEGAKRPAPGLYFIRMQHGGHVLSAKAVVGS